MKIKENFKKSAAGGRQNEQNALWAD